MSGGLAARSGAVVAADAGAGYPRVIEPDDAPVQADMAVFANIAALRVVDRFAGRPRAVVTACACT